jgi:hypothetical protein
MNPRLKEELIIEAREAVKKHGGIAAAARALGLARSTLDARMRRTFPKQEPEQVQEKQSIEASGLKAENARLKSYVAELESGGKRLPVETRAIPPVEVSDLWKHAEQENEQRIAYARERHKFSLRLDGPVCISFISDQHLSIGNTVDMKRMREDAELIAETDGAYAVLGGDGVDNHCLSDDTEVLTKRGWLRYSEVLPDDCVLGLNTETGRSQWQPVHKVIVHENYTGDLWWTNTESIDLLCTPAHRLLVKTGETNRALDGKPFVFERRNEMVSRRWIPLAADAGNDDWDGITDSEIAIVGWVLTDGWICKKGNACRYFISQRESNAEQIRRLLKDAGVPFSEHTKSAKRQLESGNTVVCATAEPLVTFSILQPFNRRLQSLLPSKPDLPEWVTQLSLRQFKIFLAAVVEGDGSANGRGWIVYGKRRFLEQLQVACLLHGMCAKTRSVPGRTEVRLLVNPKRFEQMQWPNEYKTIDVHSGVVWCLKVPLENFMVRRNGKPHFTGNCKHRSAMLAARSQPSDQWQLYDYYLSIFASKIIALISGNHDNFTDQMAGLDMVAWISKQRRLCYAPDEARIDLTVGKVLYRLAVRHQYRFNSSLNLLHTVKRWWAHGEAEFDIGTICHHHESAVESFTFHGLERWGCRPGAYQITSAYSRQYGFNATEPKCPSFILYPDERRILGFVDIRGALKTLKAER